MKGLLTTAAAVVLGMVIHGLDVHAQVLSTAETGGKGTQSLMVSANAIQPKDFGTVSNFWALYGRGVASRVDAFAGYGNVTVLGLTQSYAILGSNVGLLRRSRAGIDVLLSNAASIAVNHRKEASRVLAGTALIASHPVGTGHLVVTPYGGVNRITPMGLPAESIFTPPSRVYSGIVGLSVPLSGSTLLLIEFDPGTTQRSAGTGLVYVLPTKAAPAGASLK